MSLLRKAFSFYRKGRKGFREVRKGLNINCINLRSLRFPGVLCGFFLFRSGHNLSFYLADKKMESVLQVYFGHTSIYIQK